MTLVLVAAFLGIWVGATLVIDAFKRARRNPLEDRLRPHVDRDEAWTYDIEHWLERWYPIRPSDLAGLRRFQGA